MSSPTMTPAEALDQMIERLDQEADVRRHAGLINEKAFRLAADYGRALKARIPDPYAAPPRDPVLVLPLDPKGRRWGVGAALGAQHFDDADFDGMILEVELLSPAEAQGVAAAMTKALGDG